MNKPILTRFGFVVAIAIVAAIFSIPSHYFGTSWLGQKLEKSKITLGLDLAGGTELDYRIDLSDAIRQNSDDDITNDVNLDTIAESVRDALEKRVNPAGVGEIIVKRSQVNDEEHILIQMPPSSSVAQAKADAEKDNRLEFFEEDPTLATQTKDLINAELKKINFANWDSELKRLKAEDPTILTQKFEGRWKDEIHDPSIADKLLSAPVGAVIPEVLDTQTEMEYTITPEGKMEIRSMPKKIMAIVRVISRAQEMKDVKNPEEVTARHILFGFPGAAKADKNIRYQTEDQAKAQATKILEQLKSEGTDQFKELAKKYSTESAAQETGGSLGKFKPGQMVKDFDAAVFGKTTTGLIPELVKTEFGYHIIEVLNRTAETTAQEPSTKISYEFFGWDVSNMGWEKTKLGGSQLEIASVGYDQVGQASVDLLFNEEGGDLFAELTGKVAARKCDAGPCRLGIKVGGQWITQPTVREKIVGRKAQITGNFTFESAKKLADGLNLGAIDAPVVLSGQMTIEPTLGQDQLAKSLKAGAIGLVLTMIFMIICYNFSGVVASLALLIYAGVFITILKLWPDSFGGPIVLSLSGIAGLILSIGLAVDGNILIFERMKEEISWGHGISQALHLGFDRAWPAIRDSHISTLISCLVLYNIGSSVIKGFALTLIIGTLLSLFTALTVSRHILYFCFLFKGFQNPKFLLGLSEKQIEEKSKK